MSTKSKAGGKGFVICVRSIARDEEVIACVTERVARKESECEIMSLLKERKGKKSTTNDEKARQEESTHNTAHDTTPQLRVQEVVRPRERNNRSQEICVNGLSESDRGHHRGVA